MELRLPELGNRLRALPPLFLRAGQGLLRLRSRAEWLPWLSLGLAALLVASAAILALGYGGRLADARTLARHGARLAIEHPVVAVQPRMLPVIRSRMPGFDGNDEFSFLRDGGAAASELQAELDQVTRAVLASVDGHPYRTLGLVPARPSSLAWLGYPWVHLGLLHIGAVLLLLLCVGPVLERLWGRRLLAAVLLTATLAGGLAFYALHRGGDRPLVGASVWVAGLCAACLVRLRGRPVAWLAWLPGVEALRFSSWVVAPFWVGCELLLWWASAGGAPRGLEPLPAYAADAAGAAIGAAAALAFERLRLEDRFGAGLAEPAAARSATRFDFAQVQALRARGQAERAYELLRAEIARSARHRDAVVTYFEMAVERGEAGQAAPAMQKLIREELRRGAAEVAVSHWRSLCEAAPEARLPAELLLRLIPGIQQEDGELMARTALEQLGPTDALPLAQAAVLARLASPIDARRAAAAARRALAAEGLRPEVRADLEAIAARVRPERGEIEEEEAPPEIEAKEPPPNAFYEEQDRSAFGSVGQAELTAPGDEDRWMAPVDPDAVPNPLAGVAPARPIAVAEAIPEQLSAEGLVVQLEGRGATRIPYRRLHAVSAVGVRGLGPRPVVLVDLVVRSSRPDGRPHRVVRLRGDRFDPRRLAAGSSSPLAALRAFVAELARLGGIPCLPEAQAGQAGAIPVFEALEHYEREVLAPQL